MLQYFLVIFLLEWLDSWLVRMKQLVGPKTWADYECLYRNHVQPACQNVLLADITAQQLEDFYSKLLAVLAPSTVNKIKASILGNALRKAYAQRLIAYDPTVGIDVRREDRHHEAYTGEDSEGSNCPPPCRSKGVTFRLFLYTKKENQRLQTLDSPAFSYGARRGIRTPDPLHVTEML